MTYRIEVNVAVSGMEVSDLRRFRRLAARVLAEEGADPGEIGVVLTDDEGIRELNRQYLGRDAPTDVIAFGLREAGQDGPAFAVPGEEAAYLGDVVISVERAREQAAAYGHTWEREVDLLLVHGLLHLLGYEDEEESARQRMEARQEKLLTSFEHREPLWKAFRDAFAGLANLLRTQRNARIHIVISILVILLAALLRLALWEWAVLLLTVALVLVMETLNTAVEALVDLVSPEKRSLARRTKDLAAGAVLLAAILSVGIGVILFVPRLWEWLRRLLGW